MKVSEWRQGYMVNASVCWIAGTKPGHHKQVHSIMTALLLLFLAQPAPEPVSWQCTAQVAHRYRLCWPLVEHNLDLPYIEDSWLREEDLET